MSSWVPLLPRWAKWRRTYLRLLVGAGEAALSVLVKTPLSLKKKNAFFIAPEYFFFSFILVFFFILCFLFPLTSGRSCLIMNPDGDLNSKNKTETHFRHRQFQFH